MKKKMNTSSKNVIKYYEKEKSRLTKIKKFPISRSPYPIILGESRGMCQKLSTLG